MNTPVQITHSVPPSWVGNEYASVDCLSPDNSFILLIAVDRFILLSSTGAFLKDLKIGASEQPRWTGNSTVCFVRGNQLMQMDVSTESVATIRAFDEYAAITGKGEANLYGSLIALCGDNRGVFVFDLDSGAKGPTFAHPAPFDSLYMTPDGNVLLSDESGIHMYDRSMVFIRDVTGHNGHKAVTRDVDGKEVLVWTDNRDNHVYKVPLDGRTPVSLSAPPWAVAVDISCPAQGFAIVSTYSLDAQYPGQVLRVALDGSGAWIACETRSVMIQQGGGMAYNPQPKASISRDGSRIVFSSNDGKTVDPNYIDAWMVRLDAPTETRIDYSQWVGKSEFIMRPRPDGAIDIYERKL